MYLPLSGYAEKKKVGKERMSVKSIGSGVSSRAVRPTPEVVDAQQETHKLPPAGSERKEGDHAYPDMGYSGMSTQDFLHLKSHCEDEPYAILDKVIASMKKNMEEVGEALESLTKMVEQTSQSNLALKLLQETFEAVEKMQDR
tara:strand:+ start:3394 stop:3822 length:429 start_codon:yes stop_codon:yes gene_type:complete